MFVLHVVSIIDNLVELGIVGASRLFELDIFAQNVWFWSTGWLVAHGIPISPECVWDPNFSRVCIHNNIINITHMA